MLDKGQAVFFTTSRTNLYDWYTGGSYNENKFSLGEQVVIPFIRQQGVRHIDIIILSHLDQDHSGAFPIIQKNFEISQVQSNEYDQKCSSKTISHFVRQGRHWMYENVKVEIHS